jgi:hypothetical protein
VVAPLDRGPRNLAPPLVPGAPIEHRPRSLGLCALGLAGSGRFCRPRGLGRLDERAQTLALGLVDPAPRGREARTGMLVSTPRRKASARASVSSSVRRDTSGSAASSSAAPTSVFLLIFLAVSTVLLRRSPRGGVGAAFPYSNLSYVFFVVAGGGAGGGPCGSAALPAGGPLTGATGATGGLGPAGVLAGCALA